MNRPCRSVLYVPASRPGALARARDLACDAVILDLEDAVAPGAKAAARAALVAELSAGRRKRGLLLVRINALAGPWGAADAAAVAGLPCDGVLLPKVAGPDDLERLAHLTAHPLWAMIETPAGVLNAAAICAHRRLAGIVMGTNDLTRELGARSGPGRTPLLWALGAALVAARAAGVQAIDGVFGTLDDDEGLARECEQGRDMGFDGKSLIHPRQIAAANSAFAPSQAEVDLARRTIAAHDAALAGGQGVAVVDGRIVEGLHVAMARATLALAEAIARMEAS